MNQIGILIFVGLLNLAWLASAPAFGQTGQAQLTNPRLREAVELVKQGQAAQKSAQYQTAVTLYQKALAAFEEVLGSEHPSVATGLNNLGEVHRAMGEYAKALPLFQRSLSIREKTLGPEHANLAQSLNALAALYQSTGEYSKASSLLHRALTIREKSLGPTHPNFASSLKNMGNLYLNLGEYDKALPHYQRSLAIYEKALGPEHQNVADSLNSIGTLYLRIGEYGKAFPHFQRSISIYEKTLGTEHPYTATSVQNLASLYQQMGDYPRALALHNRSLSIREKVLGLEHADVATSLNNLALLYKSLGEYAKAISHYQRSLSIRVRSLGEVHPEVAQSLSNIAGVLASTRDYANALPLYQQSLAIRVKTFGSENSNVAASLNNIGHLHLLMGEYAKALPIYQRAFFIVGNSNSPEILWRIQDGLSMTLTGQKQTELAIFFGKQAVNTIQLLRAQLASLDMDLQKSFLTNKTYVYRNLADLLIQQGRLAEAQHVLGMLKEEEFFDFLRRSESEDPRQRKIAFQSHEQPWHDRLSALTARTSKAAAERADLERRARLGLSDAEKARLAQLSREKETLNAELQRFYAEVAQAFATAKGQGTNAPDAVAQLKATQQTLSSLGTGSVLVQYVLSENRLNVILTTPTTQIAKSTAIPEKDLNQKIEFFRVGLRNPSISALPMAQELYKLLIAPIEQELAAGNARTLMISLDGVLRYIPVSALHDGKQYLIERYDLSLYTEVTKDNLSQRPGKDMSIAGLGLTRQIENFDPLPAVRAELNAIVRNGNQGLIKGVLHFDEQFNVVNIKQALQNKHPLIHLASHFVFRPGNESTSFLLLGDGDRLTLSRIREEKLDFSHVDLVTLSACETGVGGGTNAQGEEVEGLGALVQKQGAKGVIATLWPVADESTGLLMQHFYRLREEKKISKADALRQAQLMLIKGQLAPGTSSAQRGLDAPASAAPKAAALYAHPYFWAPFILMGNWL